jgi:AbrB family looped-hinge helix DNA binding protein
MRITSKGQVTIPQHVREKAGLNPGSEVEFDIVDGRVLLRPASGAGMRRIQRAVERARGSVKFEMGTEDFMRLVRGEWPYQGP